MKVYKLVIRRMFEHDIYKMVLAEDMESAWEQVAAHSLQKSHQVTLTYEGET